MQNAIPWTSRKYLNNVSWSSQPAEKIARFMREVCHLETRFQIALSTTNLQIAELLPFLARYQDAWPAEGCMREYLSKRNQRLKRQLNHDGAGTQSDKRKIRVARDKNPKLQVSSRTQIKSIDVATNQRNFEGRACG